MPQYWWVNHSQTGRQEVEGRYLWSPKTEKNGARSEFYNNMRRAVPGDIVLSFSDGAVRFVGRVADFAFTAPKPAEFGKTGSYWNADGWWLPVFWTELTPALRPKDIIGVLGPLLPEKYSPISPVTGNGQQKAYLANISQAAFEAVVRNRSFSRDALDRGGSNSLNYEVIQEELDDKLERNILNDDSLDQTVRTSIVEARRGQGKFRANVAAVEASCRLTGITNPALLTASHIKPWGVCKFAKERLDGMNGLLLTPDADRLFDRGFISFEDSGDVVVSPRVPAEDLRRLGFDRLAQAHSGGGASPLNTGPFRAEHGPYLTFHRKEVFLSMP